MRISFYANTPQKIEGTNVLRYLTLANALSSKKIKVYCAFICQQLKGSLLALIKYCEHTVTSMFNIIRKTTIKNLMSNASSKIQILTKAPLKDRANA